eukprot:GILI01009290.1.p1 GENE.GILI01009290.1~~GILI01009290.1.p1  ORF type:complete len:150 (-),score=56.76 GILI01009290.1:75-524(-)
MSDSLVWECLKFNNSYVIKRDGQQFSVEPNNLMNLNAFKFSGLANTKAVGVHLGRSNAVVFTKKRRGCATKPGCSNIKVPLVHHFQNHKCKAANAILSETAKSFYRPDLSTYAVARYHALAKIVKARRVKVQLKKQNRPKKAKKVAAAK